MLAGVNASREAARRFLQEARILGELEHPNIVPIHNLGVGADGQVFYTMKLVQGVTLLQVLKDIKVGLPNTIARYPLSHLLIIFQKVCDAMSFAHSRQIIHRDLKPENVMLGDFGEVLVMDWGLAKHLQAEAITETPPVGFVGDDRRVGDEDTLVDNLEPQKACLWSTSCCKRPASPTWGLCAGGR